MKKWFFGAITILLLFITGAGIISLGNGLSAISAPATWRAKGEYEIMLASADALRAQTFMVKMVSIAGLLLVLVLIAVAISFLVTTLRERRLAIMLSRMEQKYLVENNLPACLPNEVYISLPAPKRENTYIHISAGRSAGEK